MGCSHETIYGLTGMGDLIVQGWQWGQKCVYQKVAARGPSHGHKVVGVEELAGAPCGATTVAEETC